MTYLTVPISSNTVEDALEKSVKAAKMGVEMVELRTDYLDDLTVEKFDELFEGVRGSNVKVIVTCRDKKEGGGHDYPAKLRLEILERAAKSGSDFIDCEYSNFVKRDFGRVLRDVLDRSNCRLILSAHDFKKPFKDIDAVYDGMLLAYPDCVAKIVFMPRHINDCFAAFDLLHHKEGDAIVIAMGEEGMITRLLAKKFDSLVCFASIDDQSTTAPGQVTVEQMKNIFRYDDMNHQSQVYGIIGNPVGHSMSPLIHNGCFDAEGINSVYVPFLVKGDSLEFGQFMENVKDREYLDIRGFSVTIPHKENAMAYVSGTGGYVDDQAVKIGAVNTLTVGFNERICAYNTDYEGAIDALVNVMGRDKSDLEHKKAAVIGAGGVSRAVVAGLTDWGAKVTIYNRTVSRAKKLAKDFVCQYGGINELDKLDCEIVVNCTSIGMYPEVENSPVPENALNGDMVVFDTVYNPGETMLLRQAKAAGAKVVSGVDMFVYQAMEQFVHFTGKNANYHVMRRIIGENL